MQTRRSFIGGLLGASGVAVLSRAAGETVPRWEIGCYTRLWAQHDYRVAFDGIAAAGFKYAGLMTSKSGMLIRMEAAAEATARSHVGLRLSAAPARRDPGEAPAGLL